MERDLRSPEFRSALQNWLDNFEVGLVRLDPSPELQEQYDQLLDGFDRFWTLLESSQADRELKSFYRSLQRRAHRLSDQLWSEAGPTPLGWLNQTLDLVTSFLDHNGPRPDSLAPLLNGQAAWVRRCDLSEEFATQLCWLADWSQGTRQATAEELRVCLERLHHHGLHCGQHLRDSYSQSLYSDPPSLEPLLEAVDELLGEVEAQLEEPQLSPERTEILERGYQELTGLEEEAERWLEDGLPDSVDDWSSRLHQVVEQLERSETESPSAACGVCGQPWLEGAPKCRFCGSRNQQGNQEEARYQTLADLDRALERFQAGYEDHLGEFLQGELERLGQAQNRLTTPHPQLQASLETMKEGYLLLLEVTQPGDPRLGRGRELVHSGAQGLAALT